LKTAAGTALIEQNCRRFQVEKCHSNSRYSTDILRNLPASDRIFIGGSGGTLKLNDTCSAWPGVSRCWLWLPGTSQHGLGDWLKESGSWNYQLLQALSCRCSEAQLRQPACSGIQSMILTANRLI